VSSLAALREQPAASTGVGLDAALMALSGRVRLRDGSLRTSEEIITELWHGVFGGSPHNPNGDAASTGKAPAPTGAATS
jgi:MoxR-like ATPase